LGHSRSWEYFNPFALFPASMPLAFLL